MFDICTKEFDMKNVQAQPIDMTDLINYYDQHHPEFRIFDDIAASDKDRRIKKKPRFTDDLTTLKINAYELVEFFIENNDANSHFILDEVPIFQQGNALQYIIFDAFFA